MNKNKICSYKNPKTGRTTYLHRIKVKSGGVLYAFKYDPVGAIPLPDGYEVVMGEYYANPYIRRVKK